MPAKTILRISLVSSGPPQQPGGGEWNVVEGGPAELLRWLEIHLGLSREPVPAARRIAQAAARFDRVEKPFWAESFATDRWSTARELLARRDELLLAGWDGAASADLPLVADLARGEGTGLPLAPGPAERLAAVGDALREGQILPGHEVEISPPASKWPAAWQPILGRLHIRAAADPEPAAERGALARAERALLDGKSPELRFDESFRWVETATAATAIEAVAAALASEPADLLGETVVLCESADAALRLDVVLARRGIPTAGASSTTLHHPALQLLPLALQMLRDPVDPEELLALLELPVGPIPRFAGKRLAAALAEEPGLGSREWETVVADLTSPETDPDGSLRARLDLWLSPPRTPRDRPLPAVDVAAVARRVAKWAMGRAAKSEGEEGRSLAEALAVAAGHASALADLVQTAGGEIGEAQLARLRDAIESNGVPFAPFRPLAGGPVVVTSLAGIERPARLVVWLGLGAGELVPSRWTPSELDALGGSGIRIDDGSAALEALRAAELRGFLRIRERLLAVSIGSEDEQRPHPLWLRIRGLFDEKEEPSRIEGLLREGKEETALSPWRVPARETAIEPPPARMVDWPLDGIRLEEEAHSSATGLELRLGCPLSFVLGRIARLRPTAIARLPEGGRLAGTFLHGVLERVLGAAAGKPLPPKGELLEALGREFDERLPRDAAPLAAPAKRTERHRLRANLLASGAALHDALSRGGYRIVGLEVPIDAEVAGRRLCGYVDCIASAGTGKEAIVDFKASRASGWRDKLAEGRATQLATYAAARSASEGSGKTAVAYLSLTSAAMATPAGSPLRGALPSEIVDGAPDIAEVWRDFDRALIAADDWFTGKTSIAARPLQSPEEWPEGAGIVLGDGSSDPSCCRFCDWPTICGRNEVK
jgi:RecB family exonuclease